MTSVGQIVLFTLEMALLSTAAILVPGVVLARLLARPWPGRSVVQTIVTLPLVLPPAAVGLGLLVLLSPRGPLGELGLGVAFTWKAVVLAAAVVSSPLLVITARAAFEEVEPEIVGVARTLGCRPVEAFVRVELPLAWRGIGAGALLAFARALGEFGATIVVAGNIPGRTRTLALALYHDVETGREGRALLLTAIAVGLAFVLVAAVELLAGRREDRR